MFVGSLVAGKENTNRPRLTKNEYSPMDFSFPDGVFSILFAYNYGGISDNIDYLFFFFWLKKRTNFDLNFFL